MQGIRPLADDPSSLRAWFPDLRFDRRLLVDPRWDDCVNPMAAAIRLADRLNTVSPTYAREIQQPNDPEHGFHGGEGLEADLQQAAQGGRLVGILNGCMYPRRNRQRPGWRRLLNTIDAEVRRWRDTDSTGTWMHNLALERVGKLPKRRPPSVLTSIGRLTSQKAELFLAEVSEGYTALDAILANLGSKGVLVLLGSGDPAFHERVFDVATRHENFLFLCGYAQDFTDLLYKAGDLFLMPSSFEPCGISQMLAMREGQPCIVHAVGGLADTVADNVNGFSFGGDTRAEQASNFVARVDAALAMKTCNPDRWLRVRSAAAAARFTWEAAAGDYISRLYE
jgi:starch synthase